MFFSLLLFFFFVTFGRQCWTRILFCAYGWLFILSRLLTKYFVCLMPRTHRRTSTYISYIVDAWQQTKIQSNRKFKAALHQPIQPIYSNDGFFDIFSTPYWQMTLQFLFDFFSSSFIRSFIALLFVVSFICQYFRWYPFKEIWLWEFHFFFI